MHAHLSIRKDAGVLLCRFLEFFFSIAPFFLNSALRNTGDSVFSHGIVTLYPPTASTWKKEQDI